MTDRAPKSFDWRKVLWPIHNHELKKFVPMAIMMLLILFSFSTLRSMKDGLVLSGIGTEAIGFLKTYIVLPSAMIAVIIYMKLLNVMSSQRVFYVIVSFFVGYMALFAFVLYPNENLIHPSPETVDNLILYAPRLKWFFKIFGKWSYATFYTIAELWGAMILNLLFWQFANTITPTEQAKRFYPTLPLVGNLGLITTSIVLGVSLSEDGPPAATKPMGVIADTDTAAVTDAIANSTTQAIVQTDATTNAAEIITKTAEISTQTDAGFTPVFIALILSGCGILLAYWWMNKYVLTDPKYFDQASTNKKSTKSKMKLSIVESIKMIFSSRYLMLIALTVLTYGLTINLVEGIWKNCVREQYVTQAAITRFNGAFQGIQGITAMIFTIIGGNVLRRTSFTIAALLTPLMLLTTGIIFFCFIFFGDSLAFLSTLMLVTPLYFAVILGAIQNILTKSMKYSLFDATRELAYIQLNAELRSKGKAAVDVVGGRLAKTSGGIIQSTTFMLFPLMSFNQAMPFFAVMFVIATIIWLFAAINLGKRYEVLAARSPEEREAQEAL